MSEENFWMKISEFTTKISKFTKKMAKSRESNKEFRQRCKVHTVRRKVDALLEKNQMTYYGIIRTKDLMWKFNHLQDLANHLGYKRKKVKLGDKKFPAFVKKESVKSV